MSTWTMLAPPSAPLCRPCAAASRPGPVAAEAGGPADAVPGVSQRRGSSSPAPPGYCLDPAASVGLGPRRLRGVPPLRRAAASTGCATRRALLTVAVSETPPAAPVVAGSEARLIDYFSTPEGRRAAEPRDGDAATSRCWTARRTGRRGLAAGAAITSATGRRRWTPSYWRAIFDLQGPDRHRHRRRLCTTAPMPRPAPARWPRIRRAAARRIRRRRRRGQPRPRPPTSTVS